jgi:DNA-binding MarR family transcriptional regulator
MTDENLDDRGGAVAPHPLLASVRSLADAVDAFDDAAARTLGVARSDLRALNLLEHGPLAAGEMGARLGLTSGSMTAPVDRLVKAGYVVRRPGEGDRRKVVVHLEPATWAAFARVYGPCGRAVATVTGRMPSRQVDAARDALAAVAAAIRTESDRLRRES